MCEPRSTVYWIYITAGSLAEAERIGALLVAQRLAACVNVLPNVVSLYRWQGEVQRDQECVLIAKTTADSFPALEGAVQEAHSYDCPCIIALPIVGGHAPFLKWIAEEVRHETS